MTKGKSTAWGRIDEKIEELRDAIVEELKSGELINILDCAWERFFALGYDLDVIVEGSKIRLTIARKAELEIHIALKDGDY